MGFRLACTCVVEKRPAVGAPFALPAGQTQAPETTHLHGGHKLEGRRRGGTRREDRTNEEALLVLFFGALSAERFFFSSGCASLRAPPSSAPRPARPRSPPEAPSPIPHSMADQELFEAWFRTADRSGTGALAGRDAVAFFGRAGLSQATLFQVCERDGEGGRGSVLRGGEQKKTQARAMPIPLRPTLPSLRSGKPSRATLRP